MPSHPTNINASNHEVQDISPTENRFSDGTNKNMDLFLDDFLRDCYQEQIDYELS